MCRIYMCINFFGGDAKGALLSSVCVGMVAQVFCHSCVIASVKILWVKMVGRYRNIFESEPMILALHRDFCWDLERVFQPFSVRVNHPLRGFEQIAELMSLMLMSLTLISERNCIVLS